MSTGPDRPVALIAGGSGLLGNALCRRLAPDYDIVAICRSRRPALPSQFESFVDPLQPDAELSENEHPAYVIDMDLNSANAPERAIDLALARHDRIDLLVNNAAMMNRHGPSIIDGDTALRDAPQMLAFNVGMPLRLAVRVAQKYWSARPDENRAQNRSVVNVSSIAGSRVYPHTGQALYAASKAGLNQLTRHLGAEFSTFGVRVNAIAPNTFPDIVSLESVVDGIMRLVDDRSVTGRVLAVDAPAAEEAGA